MTFTTLKTTDTDKVTQKDRPHSHAHLEHVNITVTDPDKTAHHLCQIFGWTIRWSGPSQHGGYTVHLGTEADYLALYTHRDSVQRATSSAYSMLNHIGVVVDDLEATESRVRDLGYIPHSHGDYEPGRRFYFHDENHIEYEVVSYGDKHKTFRQQLREKLGEMARYGALMR